MDNQNQPIQEQPEPAQSATESPSTTEPTPPATHPSQPATPSGRNLKKWIIIGGIVLVALLTSTVYVLSQQKSQKQETKTVTQPTVAQTSPTPDPTTDWKTYTNTKYGFAFKYPEDRFKSISTEIDQPTTFRLLISERGILKDKTEQPIEKMPAGVLFDVSVANLSDNLFYYTLAPDRNKAEKMITSNKITFYKTASAPPIQDPNKLPAIGGPTRYWSYGAYTESGSYKFRLSFYSSTVDISQSDKNIFDQILQTFKFTELVTEVTGTPPDQLNQAEQDNTLIHCGGVATNVPEFYCPQSYSCKYDGIYPNAKGSCIKE